MERLLERSHDFYKDTELSGEGVRTLLVLNSVSLLSDDLTKLNVLHFVLGNLWHLDVDVRDFV